MRQRLKDFDMKVSILMVANSNTNVIVNTSNYLGSVINYVETLELVLNLLLKLLFEA